MDPVVLLATDHLTVGPGEQARLAVRVRNQSRRVESYRIDVVGAAAAFARVDPPTVSVLPGREAELDVLFTPPGGPDAPSGTVPFAVRATSEVESSYSAAAEGQLELAGVTGLQVWAANNSAAGRWSGTYQIDMANQGNAATRLAVTGRDPSLAVRVSIEPELVDLRPGGRATAQLKAKARHPFLRGTPVNRTIEVTCRTVPFGAVAPEPFGAPAAPGDQDQRTLQLAFQQKPVLSKLAIVAMVVAAALLIAFLVIRLRRGDELVLDVTAPEAPPALSAVASGSSVVLLEWERVPNALGYQVREATNSGELGPEVAAVDAATLRFQVDGLEPATEHCFAVIALGPEGAADSAPTPPQCATTTPPSAVAPPDALTVTPEGDGHFALAWTYPDPTGVEFNVIVDSTRQPEVIVGLATRITLEQRSEPYEALIAVEAVREGQRSDPTAPQAVTVDPLPPEASTTVGGAPTTVSGGVAPTVVVPPTVAGGGTTTTTSPPTTTTVPPAQGVLQDLDPTAAAFLATYTPQSTGGVSLQDRINRVAFEYGVAPEGIGVFTNRDTRVRDIVGTGDLTLAPPATQFLVLPQPSTADATAFCAAHTGLGCGTLTLQGAAQAAVGTPVFVLDRLPGSTPIADLDDLIAERRAALDTQSVFALDGSEYQGFGADEIVLFVSDLGTTQQADQFCRDRLGGTCARSTLTPTP